jgi:hypothetical protein
MTLPLSRPMSHNSSNAPLLAVTAALMSTVALPSAPKAEINAVWDRCTAPNTSTNVSRDEGIRA